MSQEIDVSADPYSFLLRPDQCALVIIDMQRDFLEEGGFGETLGNRVSWLRRAIGPNQQLLVAWRSAGLPVFHTREGHLPDLSDLPISKLHRGKPSLKIGDRGPMGRILIRGEEGHDIRPELVPLAGEPVIDKPGKGAFWNTDFATQLEALGVKQLIVTGVTTEVCVHTTVREANDRGFECLVLSDATASYFPGFHETGLAMIKAQGGIFGWVSTTKKLLVALGKIESKS